MKILKLSLPLGFSLFIDMLATQTPRFFLREASGDYELGILVGLLSFLSVGSLAIESIAQAVTPRIARLVHRRETAGLRKLLASSTVASLAILAGTVAAAYSLGPSIAGLILSEEYAEYPVALAFVAAIFGVQLLYRFYVIALTSAREINGIMAVNLIALVVTVALSVLLISDYGINGAVGTLLVMNIVRLILIAFMLRGIDGLFGFIFDRRPI